MQLGASHLRAKAHNAKICKIDEFNCSMNNAEQGKRCTRRNVEDDDDKDWTLRRLRPPKSQTRKPKARHRRIQLQQGMLKLLGPRQLAELVQAALDCEPSNSRSRRSPCGRLFRRFIGRLQDAVRVKGLVLTLEHK